MKKGWLVGGKENSGKRAGRGQGSFRNMDYHETVRKGGVVALREILASDGWLDKSCVSQGETDKTYRTSKNVFLRKVWWNAVEDGELDVMKCVDLIYPEVRDNYRFWSILTAICNGHLEVLKYLNVEEWFKGHESRVRWFFNRAIISGQRHILKYLMSVLEPDCSGYMLSVLLGELAIVWEKGYWKMSTYLIKLLKERGYEPVFPMERDMWEEVRINRLRQLMCLERLSMPEDLMRVVDEFLL